MVKPFNPKELVLRVKSLMRRMEKPKYNQSEIIIDGPFKLINILENFF